MGVHRAEAHWGATSRLYTVSVVLTDVSRRNHLHEARRSALAPCSTDKLLILSLNQTRLINYLLVVSHLYKKDKNSLYFLASF